MAAVIVHGGAFSISDEMAPLCVKGCEEAASEAHKALVDGKSALDGGRPRPSSRI